MLSSRRWQTASVAVVAALALVLTGSVAFAGRDHSDGLPHGPLPLGPAGLTERRTTQTIAPGLELTTITRGRPDPASQFWTLGVNLPLGEVKPDPDPDADQGALGTLAKAQEVAAQIAAIPAVVSALAGKGWQPRIEPVDYVQPLIGYPGGLIGYTLRIGRYEAKPTAADPVYAALLAARFKLSVVNTGQDGRPDSTGPWVVRVLSVDFHKFHGKIQSSVGDHVSGQQSTTSIAQKNNAIFAVNGGFFVINPADGTLGVPAGLTVLNGKPVTAATNNRVALVLGDYGRDTHAEKLTSRNSLRFLPANGVPPRGGDQGWYAVDGLNRNPGLIRDCGGVGGDTPTQRPAMDFTCKDTSEVIVFTPEFGTVLPAGEGIEVIVDSSGKVVSTRPRTGLTAPAGATVVQAIGTAATWLSAHALVGTRLQQRVTTLDSSGRAVNFGHDDFVINGGPQLVDHGRVAVNPEQDGLLHDSPTLGLPTSGLGASWAYSWVVRNNPRTGVGVDSEGRLLIVQADGRQENLSQGLGILEFAKVMKALGAVEAINLDGGGSSATVVNGQLISSPSDVDAAGNHVERSVGDALLITK